MGAARVVAEEVDHVGGFDVLVHRGRMVAAQRGDVAGDRRRHAHARIGLDGIRLQHRLHILVFEPLLLHGQLARAVGGDGVAAELPDDADGHVGHQLRGLVPSDLAEHVVVEPALGRRYVTGQRVRHVLAHEHLVEPVDIDGLGRGQPLDALHAEVDAAVLVRHRGDDAAALDHQVGMAADAAIGALGGHQLGLFRALGGGGDFAAEIEHPVVMDHAEGPDAGADGGRGPLQEPAPADLLLVETEPGIVGIRLAHGAVLTSRGCGYRRRCRRSRIRGARRSPGAP